VTVYIYLRRYMAAATWDQVRLQLLAHGYRKILYFELSCADHGDFRSAYEPDGEFHPACPRCGRPSEATILAEGFTRRQTIRWERVAPPTPHKLKTDIDNDSPRQGPRLPVFRGPALPDAGKSAEQSAEGVETSDTIPKAEKASTLKPRDVLILKLLAEDHSPDSIAEKLNPPTNGRAVVMAMYRVRKVLHCSTTTGAVVTAMRQGLI